MSCHPTTKWKEKPRGETLGVRENIGSTCKGFVHKLGHAPNFPSTPVDAHREGKRFIVRPDEKVTAFMELQWRLHALAVSLI